MGHEWGTSGASGRNQLAVPECAHTLMLGFVLAKVGRGSKDHLSIRILHSGSQAQDKESSTNHGM